MGGFIAQAVALEHAARVRTLTLMMTSTGSRRVEQPKPRVYARLLRRRVAGDLSRGGRADDAEAGRHAGRGPAHDADVDRAGEYRDAAGRADAARRVDSTPPGWDSVYTPVFNIERPIAPMLIVRVETDWYMHETEFRYVLQPGEMIAGGHSQPIGQVVFVPREEVSLRVCDDAELAAIRESQARVAREKAAHKVTTSYGMSFSPHYLRSSRSAKP